MTGWGSPKSLTVWRSGSSFQLVVTSPDPVHLWMGWQDEQPLKQLLHRSLRGVPLIRALAYRFTGVQFVEQNEPGPTEVHTFDWPLSDPSAGLWWFLTNETVDPALASTTPPARWPWEDNVTVAVAARFTWPGPQSVGASGFHELTGTVLATSVNWPGNFFGSFNTPTNIPPGVYAITYTVNMRGTGTSRYDLRLNLFPNGPSEGFQFRESASEAEATYQLSYVTIQRETWGFNPLIENQGATTAAVLGTGIVPAAVVEIALISPL